MARTILIFGGNGMMGFETLTLLLEDPALSSLRIYLVNRGRSWDWDKKKLLQSATTEVNFIKWNRKKPLSECSELVQLVAGVDMFDAVLDFSGYVKYYIEQAVELLKGKVGTYVYISTDSIYEVCVQPSHDGPSKESEDVRPDSPKVRDKLNEADEYGHEKLECEETLQHHFKETGFPFVCLRLPDVIGPRDGTERWFQCQVWITALGQATPSPPIYILQALKDKSICLVYSKDVARLIVQLLAMPPSDRLPLMGQSYNLGFKEPLTVEYVFDTIRECVGPASLNISHTEDLDPPIVYPSVMRGPVDITKALTMLKWNPTSFKQAVLETTSFYTKAMTQTEHAEEKESCLKDLLKDIKPLYSKSEYQTLKQIMKNILKL